MFKPVVGKHEVEPAANLSSSLKASLPDGAATACDGSSVMVKASGRAPDAVLVAQMLSAEVDSA